MIFFLGIITYNRVQYLKGLIESWEKTRNKDYFFDLVVADDGSTDGTEEYLKSLKFDNANIKIINNKRRGVHHQVNQVLKYSLSRKYDLGFMAEDDMYFLNSGWEDAYYDANKKSGYDHLCFFDFEWAKKYRGPQIVKNPPVIKAQRSLQSYLSGCWEVFGVFWTFTHKVIEKVGYFDLNKFGLWGSAHTDYSFRCCRAGMNSFSGIYDALGSEKYLKMFYQDYIPALKGDEINFAMYYNIPDRGQKGLAIADNNRIFVPYNELPYDMNGKEI